MYFHEPRYCPVPFAPSRIRRSKCQNATTALGGSTPHFTETLTLQPHITCNNTTQFCPAGDSEPKPPPPPLSLDSNLAVFFSKNYAAVFTSTIQKMALLNPVYSLILPFLFVFTVPIAILATITTTLAFSILAFRVILVYIELAIAVIPHYLLGRKFTSSKPLQRNISFSNPSFVPGRRRKRRSGSSSSSLSAAGSITPVQGENGIGLSQSIGPTRDYEGVGGWRLDNPSDDDALWTSINSRLELPADHVRRHHRSMTSGSTPGDARQNRSYSPEAMMNTSRTRTPPNSAIGGEGYFPDVPVLKSVQRTVAPSCTGSTLQSGGRSRGSVLHMKQK